MKTVTFTLSQSEYDKYIEWKSTREDEYCGAIGGRYTFSFTFTTLGRTAKVTDNLRNEELDLTDYTTW